MFMIVINDVFCVNELKTANIILTIIIIVLNLTYFILQLLKFIKKLTKSENITDFIFIIVININ